MQNLFSKSVIGFSAVVFLSLLALNMTNHAYYMGSLGSVFYHYAVPSVLVAAAFLSLMLPPSERLSVALCLVAVVFGLYVAELYLTFEHDSRRSRAALATGEDFDKRSKIQVINDLRRGGDDAYPAMNAKLMLGEEEDGEPTPLLKADGEPFLPIASIPLKTVVSCNESGRWLIYGSDEHGFHNPPGAWRASPLNIAIVGDSFAHGSCVPSGDNAAAWLRRRFGGVLNLGVSGAGPLLMMAAFREYVEPLKPRAVLWLYYEGNDLTENMGLEKRSPFLMRYYNDGAFRQGLMDRAGEVTDRLKAFIDERLEEAVARDEDPYEVIQDFLMLYHLRERLGLGPLSFGIFDGGGGRKDLELFRGVLEKARRSVESWGGKMYFVFLPESERYFAAERDNDIRDHLRRQVLETVDGLNIKLIDVHRAFSEQPAPRRLFQFPGSHYNIQGYKVVGEAIGEALSDVAFAPAVLQDEPVKVGANDGK